LAGLGGREIAFWGVFTPFQASSVSVEGIEPSTNGLKGQKSQHASPIQWPAFFAQSTRQVTNQVHWTLFKGQSTRKRPRDLFLINLKTDSQRRRNADLPA
jgi:hypothetical protein